MSDMVPIQPIRDNKLVSLVHLTTMQAYWLHIFWESDEPGNPDNHFPKLRGLEHMARKAAKLAIAP